MFKTTFQGVTMKSLPQGACLAVFALAATGAQAQGVYGEVAYVPLKLDARLGSVGLSAKPKMVRGIVGFDLHPNFAAEAMVGLGAGSDTLNVSGFSSGVTVKVKDMVGVFAKPKLVVAPNVELFGRLGFTSTNLSLAGDTSRESSLAYGLGMSYAINPMTRLSADYMIYHDKDDTQIKGYSVGLGLKF
jgi:opacity protein-like surface antigen